MAGITLSDAEAILDALITAQLSINASGHSSVEVLGKKLSFEDPTKLQATIDYWDKKCKELAAAGTRTARRVRGGTPS